MAEFFNTGLSQQQFLEQYWQKKPLLIRQAFADFQSPLTPEDLAGLACEPEIESRLIEEKGEQGSWQISHGPFSEHDFARLPASHWTMLVQDVDKHVPETQSLLDPFRFIPDWRRDDLMVSFAPEHGTVGPHTDGYDVFLVQAMGTRRWMIGNEALDNPELISGLDVQILAEFDPDETWDLQPGDILYLPPFFAHHGVALNDCMTFSVGFRSPSQTDMLDAVVNSVLEHGLASKRYQDPDLSVMKHSHEIDGDSIQRLKAMLHKTIDQAEPILVEALGRYVSDTKSSLVELAEQTMSELPTIGELEQQFEVGNRLQRSLYHRFAWSNIEQQPQLFMAAEAYCIDSSASVMLPVLTQQTVLDKNDWQLLSRHPSAMSVLCQLIAEGGWYWQSEID